MINHLVGIAFDTTYFEPRVIDYFTSTYLAPLGLLNLTGQDLSHMKTFVAGKAVVIFR